MFPRKSSVARNLSKYFQINLFHVASQTDLIRHDFYASIFKLGTAKQKRGGCVKNCPRISRSSVRRVLNSQCEKSHPEYLKIFYRVWSLDRGRAEVNGSYRKWNGEDNIKKLKSFYSLKTFESDGGKAASEGSRIVRCSLQQELPTASDRIFELNEQKDSYLIFLIFY